MNILLPPFVVTCTCLVLTGDLSMGWKYAAAFMLAASWGAHAKANYHRGAADALDRMSERMLAWRRIARQAEQEARARVRNADWN